MKLKETIFNNIPTEMRRKDVFVLEGIRYAYGMINLTYKNLEILLLHASTKKESESINFYGIFKEAWSLIDLSWRLRNIICLLENKSTENNKSKLLDLSFFNPVREFRNTLQHLDERIEEVLVVQNDYLWGTLSWLYTKDAQKFLSISMAPGHPRSSVSVNAINPAGQNIKIPLSHITLDSLNRQKLRISLNLTELYEQIDRMLLDLDAILRPQIEKMDNSKKFGQDLMIVIEMKPKKN